MRRRGACNFSITRADAGFAVSHVALIKGVPSMERVVGLLYRLCCNALPAQDPAWMSASITVHFAPTITPSYLLGQRRFDSLRKIVLSALWRTGK